MWRVGPFRDVNSYLQTHPRCAKAALATSWTAGGALLVITILALAVLLGPKIAPFGVLHGSWEGGLLASGSLLLSTISFTVAAALLCRPAPKKTPTPNQKEKKRTNVNNGIQKSDPFASPKTINVNNDTQKSDLSLPKIIIIDALPDTIQKPEFFKKYDIYGALWKGSEKHYKRIADEKLPELFDVIDKSNSNERAIIFYFDYPMDRVSDITLMHLRNIQEKISEKNNIKLHLIRIHPVGADGATILSVDNYNNSVLLESGSKIYQANPNNRKEAASLLDEESFKTLAKQQFPSD